MIGSKLLSALTGLSTVGAVVLLMFELGGRRLIDRPLRERMLLIVFLASSALAFGTISQTVSAPDLNPLAALKAPRQRVPPRNRRIT